MTAADFREMDAHALTRYMASQREKDYLLIDVRQPAEYEAGHSAGAKLMPIMKLVAGIYDLPADRDLIFYCRNGGRSTAAAALAAEEGVTCRSIFHLTGGIMAWQGRLSPGYPKIKRFSGNGELASRLRVVMDLEKGALRFYDYHVEKAHIRQLADAITLCGPLP